MKRTLRRSILKPSAKPEAEEVVSKPIVSSATESVEPAPAVATRIGGAGSAWKSGALAQAQGSLDRSREQIADDILHGRHELRLAPGQISDPLGTDRRADWMEQDRFLSLLSSIEQNGQDTPILVWPEDPDWKPDLLQPEAIENVPFILLTGRRRHAAAERLGRPLRAVLGPHEKRSSNDSRFEMLFMRFRENEERENLGAFEHLTSIGEMYETLRESASGEKLTAVLFAKRIGVHESVVSRGRAVYKARDEILNAFKNVYDMSFAELQKALATLSEDATATPKKRPKFKKITVKRKIGNRNLSVISDSGNLSVKAAGLNLDKPSLERLGDLIAAYLQEQGSEESSK